MLKLDIKINLKENVLSWFKLLSYNSVSHIPYEIHKRMFPQAPTRDCKQHFETGIISTYHMGAYHKGDSNANDRKSIFDVSFDYVRKQ